MIDPVLSISGVQKSYSGLRPLRIQSLTVRARERVALGGVDAAAAELLVNLITGATLPDSGSVRVLGQPTSEIATGDEWLASLDRFGIVSPRAVILEGSTVQQNLALPFSLEMDRIPATVMEQVGRLAAECGIDPGDMGRQAGELPAHVRSRIHLARASNRRHRSARAPAARRGHGRSCRRARRRSTGDDHGRGICGGDGAPVADPGACNRRACGLEEKARLVPLRAVRESTSSSARRRRPAVRHSRRIWERQWSSDPHCHG
jgi:ABC-type lipoprotein export system ATPase subunit